MTTETIRDRARRYGRLLFVAAVTAALLGLVIEQATTGPAGIPGAVVYALCAGFGLEFVGSAWTGRTTASRAPETRPGVR